ncbi:hypothetical protein BKG71_18745, partial [Mycobacteroides chelonae]
IWTNPVANFGGSKNDTINVRIPAILASRSRTFRGTGGARTPVADDLVEHVFGITLDEVIYSYVNLTDEQLTLDIRSYAEQVLMPQVSAIAYGLEDYIASNLLTAAPYEETFALNPADNYPAIVDARQWLNDENVPDDDRTLVVGATVESAMLKDTQLRHFEKSGDASNEALRRAEVMNLAGLRVIRSNAIPTDEAFLFHRTAFAMTNVGPVKPASIAHGAAMSTLGYALRWYTDYDFTNQSDRSLLDTYVGHKIITEEADSDRFVRATKLKLSITGINAGADFALGTTTGTRQLRVKDSNGVDRTASATFVSATPAKATVSAGGLVTGVAAGTSVVTATYADPVSGTN